ncbi:hypothetical protein R1sor_023634 [Riccia sorocarpa]|uniref:DDE Tnp4 domain-containing protein n=1 Tax=Riccia sorocarpa TaxID=122646 RepID=A0ABD3GNZ1_9MARC
MPYELFLRLVDLIEAFMPPLSDWHLARKRTELKKYVAVVIYRLAHNVSLQELSDKFHVGQAGVVKYTRIITEIFADRRKLFCKFVGLPKGSRLSSIIEDFARLSGIPHIAGSIDGCQIKLRNKPQERYFPAEYWNRHHTFSVLLQGVRNFLDVTCVLPGSQHDASHLRVSSLWYKLTNNLIFQQPEIRLPLSGESRTEGGWSSRAARNNPEEQQEAGSNINQVKDEEDEVGPVSLHSNNEQKMEVLPAAQPVGPSSSQRRRTSAEDRGGSQLRTSGDGITEMIKDYRSEERNLKNLNVSGFEFVVILNSKKDEDKQKRGGEGLFP